MKQATQDKNGNPIVIEVPDIEPEPVIWHETSKQIQLIISNELKQDWLMKNAENDILGNYPEIAGLLNYVKNLVAPKYQDNINLYIYLDEIYPEHRGFLEQGGVIINQ